MRKIYSTSGTCSSEIEVEVNEAKIITEVKFKGGCNGNLQGISKLVVGRPIDEVINLLKGTRCGTRPTSCPDQLCRALEQFN